MEGVDAKAINLFPMINDKLTTLDSDAAIGDSVPAPGRVNFFSVSREIMMPHESGECTPGGEDGANVRVV